MPELLPAVEHETAASPRHSIIWLHGLGADGHDFVPVVPELVAAGMGVLGMKSMGNGVILKSGAVTPLECLHYALSLPTSVVITGIDSMKVLEQAFEAARTFKPMKEQEVASLLARTKASAAKGEFELFKTATRFDGTVQHPEWLGLEG